MRKNYYQKIISNPCAPKRKSRERTASDLSGLSNKYIKANDWPTTSHKKLCSVNKKAEKVKEEVLTANYNVIKENDTSLRA